MQRKLVGRSEAQCSSRHFKWRLCMTCQEDRSLEGILWFVSEPTYETICREAVYAQVAAKGTKANSKSRLEAAIDS
eukprot:6463363-Amphidinium_carterae.1